MVLYRYTSPSDDTGTFFSEDNNQCHLIFSLWKNPVEYININEYKWKLLRKCLPNINLKGQCHEMAIWEKSLQSLNRPKPRFTNRFFKLKIGGFKAAALRVGHL
jgi:hypothetical protein